ncbi:DEAD/DEAH box helicase family protein [Neolewinella persica]|uniref:AAA family ATPase n=1 Tax=Neolewinella persica TaxID=70998 RepID=UPI00036B4E0C|nr:AAA family ATPase [Neolewinella persica]
MKFILIFGPSAVGKMTVGKALAEKTGYKLFHNHVSLELANRLFDFGTEAFRKLDSLVRFGTFEVAAESNMKGFIFTFCWALDLPSEAEYVDRIVNIFKAGGAHIHYVELEAAQDVRLQRNRHPDRLDEKASKRDIAHSEGMLLADDKKYRQNTRPGEMPERKILKINNANLTPDEVAERIVAHYDW